MARVRTQATIGLYVVWQVAMFGVILQRIAAFGVAALPDLWYAGLINAAFAWFVAKQVDRRAKGEIQELLTLDLVESVYPMSVSFAAHFAGLLLFYSALGLALSFPGSSDVLRQLLVVTPVETFVWVFFLPRILQDYFRVPAWIWSAVSFGAFHWWAYGGNVAAMMLAAIFCGIWYQLYEARAKYRFLGLPFVWMSHFAINVFALAAKASVAYLILHALGVATIVPEQVDALLASVLVLTALAAGVLAARRLRGALSAIPPLPSD